MLLKLTNSATGGDVIIGAFGDDDVGITITPKGTGKVNISGGNLNYAGTTITATGAELKYIRRKHYSWNFYSRRSRWYCYK